MKLYLIAAIVAASIAGLIWVYSRGGDDVRGDIERQDTKAANRSDADRSVYDLCPPGQWDFGKKKCAK